MKITLYTGKIGKELLEEGSCAFANLFPEETACIPFTVNKENTKFVGHTKDNMLYFVKGDVEFEDHSDK